MYKLWLSPDFDPANKVRIGYHNHWNQPYEWDKRATQQSNPITFEAGQIYYVEAIFKERDRHDNGAVAWQRPGIPERAVIDGSFLSPVHDGECTSVAYHLSGLSEQLELGFRLDITFAGQPVDAADLPCGHHYAFDHLTDLDQVIAGMGLNYFGARCYDAEIGLWIAVDRKREA